MWEQENYLLKMKSDSLFLTTSTFSHYFNFSSKSDPFLVYPSSKHSGAVGSGALALKKLKSGQPSAKKPSNK